MSGVTSPVLDLLRERRRELGIETISSTLVRRRSLLQRGALIGLAVVGGVAGLCAVVLLQNAVVRSRMAQLEQVESEAAALQAQLKARQQNLKALSDTNKTLVEALTSGRTSAALLAELQLITPQGVQLMAVDSSGEALLLKGQAFDPFALVRINALLLQLQRSALFQADGVKLTKVERQPASTPDTPAAKTATAAKSPEPGPVGFEIQAPFAPLDPQQQLDLLRRLGSAGMAQRLQLLRQEGLMP
jgi:type IV pilus assembly protein PilN